MAILTLESPENGHVFMLFEAQLTWTLSEVPVALLSAIFALLSAGFALLSAGLALSSAGFALLSAGLPKSWGEK